MSTVLVLTSSVLGEASVSNRLVEEVVARLRSQEPDLHVIARDLGRNPLPHLTIDAAVALRGGDPANADQAEARALSDNLVAELKAAETVIIGAPMYNFGIPSTLKSWFDHVLRAGVTFQYSASGAAGLLTEKRAIVIESRGGLYSEGPAQAMDAQEPHLRALLGFMGITDVTFIRAERLALGAEAHEQAIGAARARIVQAV
ncbi:MULTISPECIES: FMN-dependent NADH-azoreductase [Azospirillum]|uniref:FMN dependent NADH:quinone oxidoreductase n=1 Tax=Azospirillum brasilense TaxID=192 RepID=A0ABU4PEY3_AZOBR|nr:MULTISPECIES: FMN-dependent NADH-azoreductase [Azospirillum]ALJ39368.1 FMN-dependent NADH-azoreductase [Azospirillum brasilense]MDX5955851.1 FMN-dependent NADH-azoreductase [Azospirillum brasilense]NUB23991.1 FMN-dependent NADH-azoreductase [Azospirillum brasilense]NUB33983.1 FMN-dependent NADH-azoreductase [Azospirillum brasilense]PWC87396.1 FMN-dependent NADH-azoreductase [Azospirillum sp. Sp 7]